MCTAGEIQAIVSLMDAQAVGYDLTITPSDNRGNVGQPKILTVVVTGTLVAQLSINLLLVQHNLTNLEPTVRHLLIPLSG